MRFFVVCCTLLLTGYYWIIRFSVFAKWNKLEFMPNKKDWKIEGTEKERYWKSINANIKTTWNVAVESEIPRKNKRKRDFYFV